MDALADIE